MAINDYHFITHWRVEGTLQEVYDILSSTTDLPRWWPAVYLDATEKAADDERGIGKAVALHTRGWLPYGIWWQSRLVESREPFGYTLEAQGDFVGRGVWIFEQDGPWVNITFDWRIRAEKPLLRYLSFLLRPAFAANHRWAMAKGEESLRVELARRRARTEQERAHVAAPPQPNQDFLFWIVSGLLVMGIAASMVRRRK
jgi:hypothetical protein